MYPGITTFILRNKLKTRTNGIMQEGFKSSGYSGAVEISNWTEQCGKWCHFIITRDQQKCAEVRNGYQLRFEAYHKMQRVTLHTDRKKKGRPTFNFRHYQHPYFNRFAHKTHYLLRIVIKSFLNYNAEYLAMIFALLCNLNTVYKLVSVTPKVKNKYF
jgi:hypothetical protein